MIRLMMEDPETAVDLFKDDDAAQLMRKCVVGQLPAHVRPLDQCFGNTQRTADDKRDAAAGMIVKILYLRRQAL